MELVVIGAGPAGMLAALEAARLGDRVTLVEKNSLAGKKLRITGAGRGNLTNLNVDLLRFRSKNYRFLEQCLNDYGYPVLAEYLCELGILTFHTDDGWVYPLSNSAANVADILAARVAEAGVRFWFDTEVTEIHVLEEGFLLSLSGRQHSSLRGDKLVVSSGGCAYPNLGSDGRLFEELRKLGHTIFPVHPALAPILLDMRIIHGLQGLRLDAGVTLWKREEKIGEAFGNIIFTNWGVNGPGVMDISHLVSLYGADDMYAQFNLIAPFEEQARKLIDANRRSTVPIAVLLGSFLPPKAVVYFTHLLKLAPGSEIAALDANTLEQLLEKISCLRVAVKGVKGFDQCQVSTGGVSLDEVDPVTLQSEIVTGLFFAGEVLDLFGPCGGYNLHWAFCSGIVAGRGSSLKN